MVVSLEDEVNDLLAKRSKAKLERDYVTADKIRDLLLEMGIELRDGQGGAVGT